MEGEGHDMAILKVSFLFSKLRWGNSKLCHFTGMEVKLCSICNVWLTLSLPLRQTSNFIYSELLRLYILVFQGIFSRSNHQCFLIIKIRKLKRDKHDSIVNMQYDYRAVKFGVGRTS